LIKFSESIWNEIAPEGNTKRDQLVYNYCIWKNSFTDYALFSFENKCKLITFKDHPNRPSHKEKVLMVGPWIGEEQYEHKWVSHVKSHIERNVYDKVIVGCRPNRENMYADISPDRFIISNPNGVKNKYMLDGNHPRFNIKSNDKFDIVELIPNKQWFELKTTITQLPNKIGKVNVYYNYYITSNIERNEELQFCIDMLISNEEIDNIYLIVDEDTKVEFHNDKIAIIVINHRPTFNNFFEQINNYTDDTDVNIIINSDCFILEDSILKIKNNICDTEAWILSRKELISPISFSWIDRMDATGSQDAWCVKGKVKELDADFMMGLLGCDNKIAYLLYTAGYIVLNPSNDIIVYHYHTTQLRTYDENGRLPTPYLFTNICESNNKIEEIYLSEETIIHNPFAYTYVKNKLLRIIHGANKF